MGLLTELAEEVADHDALDSDADPEEARVDRDRTLGTLESMRTLLEHIGELVSSQDGTSG